MQICKKINNNVALARDAKGRELVVFGKGIGFPAMPYELTDLSGVQRTFYDVNEKYFALLREIPGEVFLLADDIAANAQDELDCSLSPNLTYALADHLNFAIQRCRDGIALQTPLAYDIRHLYPQEYALAKQALHQIRDALHDMHSTILTAKVVSEISALMEKTLSVKLDKDSFSFSRFAMHLRYLVQRMMHGKPLNGDNSVDSMFRTVSREYPEIYACVQQINEFLTATYGWPCSREEQLYLIMHIHRVCCERTEED